MKIQCTLTCFSKGWLSSNPDIKKFVGNHYARVQEWVKIQYGLVTCNLNPPGFFFFYKLDEIYNLLNANKIPKKNDYC